MADPTPRRSVRGKFYVREVTAIAGMKGGNVVLSPVTRGAANAP